jgi:hypothetical protein
MLVPLARGNHLEMKQAWLSNGRASFEQTQLLLPPGQRTRGGVSPTN